MQFNRGITSVGKYCERLLKGFNIIQSRPFNQLGARKHTWKLDSDALPMANEDKRWSVDTATGHRF